MKLERNQGTSDFGDGWRFYRGESAGASSIGFDDTEWEPVALPHPARIEARVTDRADHQQWEGICWYRKTVTLPVEARGQVVSLRFEGAMNRAEVWVNGRKAAENLDGYLPFVVDLTEVAGAPDPITLAVRLDNTHNVVTGPKPLPQLDFHLYHGIYRTVSLRIQSPLHITDAIQENQPASGGVFVTYPQVSETSATVRCQVHVRNRSELPAHFSVVTRLVGARGEEHRQESPDNTLQSGEDRAFVSALVVPSPQRWSPRSPHLYDLEVQLVGEGRILDVYRERIGIRRLQLEPGGLVLDGEKLYLRGVNRHQEYPYVGNAVPANAQYRDAYKIKQAGFDFVRLSHYPQSPAFLDACDALGLVVMDAILGWQFNPETPAFESNRIEAARQLVRRDRNRPSVVMWELSLNETHMSDDFIRRLHEAGHEEYPGDQMFTCGWMHGYDIKLDSRQAGSTAKFREADYPALVSEYGDWEYYAGNAGLNQDAWGDLKSPDHTSRQLRGSGEVGMLQQGINFQEAHNENRSTRAMGDGLWVMYDYNRGYADDLESSGCMDLFRLPKFSYYFFQSQRDPTETPGELAGGPMVFAATFWNESSPKPVRVFSNCDEVELFLNGHSLGRQKPDRGAIADHLPHPPFLFPVERFVPGELTAVGYLQGNVVARHQVRTATAPHHLDILADLSGKPLATADLIFVYARIVDAAGTVVPEAQHPVTFEITGDARLVGDNPAVAEAGIAAILLKTGSRPGSITVRAQAGALRGEAHLTAC